MFIKTNNNFEFRHVIVAPFPLIVKLLQSCINKSMCLIIWLFIVSIFIILIGQLWKQLGKQNRGVARIFWKEVQI